MKGYPSHGHIVTRIILAVLALAVLGLVASHLIKGGDEERQQESLQSFYETPANLAAAKPGQVLRSEPVALNVPAGGAAERILYRSERSDGTPTVSSGLVFFPAKDAAAAGRPVVAWAHGTIGLGDSCAPSRSENPTADMNWLGGMLARGWIVTATDYAGLGTEGNSRYLIGGDEARDVLNSVRAARNLDPAVGDRFALWGHSQGGHSALWSAGVAGSYAPELRLVGTAAGAPAAELVSLFSEQTNAGATWVIGPDVLATWPEVYPNLDLAGVVSPRGLKVARKVSQECAVQSAEGALVRHGLGERFFETNPMNNPSWRQAAQQQTPPPLTPNQPLLIAQSLSDQVVLPNTTARLATTWCAAGSNLGLLWIDQVPHQKTAIVAGPAVTDWLGDRFAGKPVSSTCAQPLPLAPASV